MTAQKLRELLEGNPLTDLEVEVLHWAAMGETATQTAKRLDYAPETVRERRKMAAAKLGANNTTRAVVIAIGTGLLNIVTLLGED